MNRNFGIHASRRLYLRRVVTVGATVAAPALSGCSTRDSGDDGLVTIEDHGRDGALFYVEIKNGHPVEVADVTVVLELRDERDAVVARLERRVTIDSGTSRRIEVEIESGDVDGDLEDVDSYAFELDGERTE